jgi:quercetin dioxygenase-like cupin family protein
MANEKPQNFELSPKRVPPGGGKRLQILAETGFLKLAGPETGGHFALMEGWTPPGAGPPLHRHTHEDETFYILEGEYEFIVGDSRLRAPVGSVVFGPRGIFHTFKNIGTSQARILVYAQPAGVEHFFEELSDLVKSGAPDPAKLTQLASRYGITFEV